MPRIIKPAVGSFTASNITIDSSGRVISASSGAGAANMVRTHSDAIDGTRTFTAQPGSSKLHVYLRGAGGGGGGGLGGQVGSYGGYGGFGFFNVPITQPYSAPYTIGAGGTGGQSPGHSSGFQNGSAGAATSFNTNLVANGGGGGGGSSNPQPGPSSIGTSGTLQNETYAIIDGNPASEATAHAFHEASAAAGIPSSGVNTNAPQIYITNATSPFGNLGDLRMRLGGTGGIGGNGPHGGSNTRTAQQGQSGGLVVYEDLG